MLNSSYTTSQSEDSGEGSTRQPIYLRNFESHLLYQPFNGCEASRRHLEECSICSRQTSSLTSEISQVPSSQIEQNPEWPLPCFRPRPQFFPSALTDVSRPGTPDLREEEIDIEAVHLNPYLSTDTHKQTQLQSSPLISVQSPSPCQEEHQPPQQPNNDPPKHYVQLANNSPRITYLPTLTKLHPQTQMLHPLMFTEAGTQTDISNISNGVSCLTTAQLLFGVMLSAIGFVVIIFFMKCKFRIGFQMNMCYYM